MPLRAAAPDSGVMTRPPRPVTERLLSGPVVGRFLFLGAIQAAGVCFAFFWRIHSAHLGFGDFTAANPVYREASRGTAAEQRTTDQWPCPRAALSARLVPELRNRGKRYR
jgi:P-type Ca2+ transporter type 2C